ncbi:hypothetical protein NC651_026578 [Populus alba x Populus x berolinensis]|nr:hypothetical protein NC651_026578 [Populus alba x Populus x berolinensis]
MIHIRASSINDDIRTIIETSKATCSRSFGDGTQPQVLVLVAIKRQYPKNFKPKSNRIRVLTR